MTKPTNCLTSVSSTLENRFYSPKALCAITGLAIAVIAGSVLAVLGAKFFPVGTVNFYLTIISGGTLALATSFILSLIAVTQYKKHSLEQTIPSQKTTDLTHRREVVDNFINTLTPNVQHAELTNDLKQIEPDLHAIRDQQSEEERQENSKNFFTQGMNAIGSEVYFQKAGTAENLGLLTGSLNKNVFQLSVSEGAGVTGDIPRSSKDKEHTHIYQVASQYNAAEAKHPYTPKVGEAVKASATDNTQGPLAQRTNPVAFELVTAFLTHLGFNMLDKVLSKNCNTYTQNSPVEHGYLRPTDTTIPLLTKQFKKNYSEAEFVCYSSHAANWEGEQPVYLMLQAAPAIGYSHLTLSSEELEKYASMQNYLALFRQGIQLAKDKKKPVVIHVTAVGGGVFLNKSENIEWGFKQAALALQDQMQTNGVSVQIEAFTGPNVPESPWIKIANKLDIDTKDRIGDNPPKVDNV